MPHHKRSKRYNQYLKNNDPSLEAPRRTLYRLEKRTKTDDCVIEKEARPNVTTYIRPNDNVITSHLEVEREVAATQESDSEEDFRPIHHTSPEIPM